MPLPEPDGRNGMEPVERLSDTAFLSEIYEKHKGIMYKTALECSGAGADKDGIVHDSLLRLAQHIDTLRQLNDHALAVYVATTVRSVAFNGERRKRTERRRLVDADVSELESVEFMPSYEEQYIEAEAHRDRLRYLRESLAELDDTDRELLVGKYIAGQSDDELARRFGIKPESVRMKLTRARRRVRKMIERKEGGNGLY